MSCFCPPSFSASPDNTECIQVLTANTTGSLSTLVTQKGITYEGIYGLMGTVFYEDITNLKFPIISSGVTNHIVTQNGTLLYSTTCWIDQNNRVLNFQLGGPGKGESILPGFTNLPSTYFGPQIFPSLNDTSTVWGTSSTKGRLNYCGVWPTITDPAPPIGGWIGFTVCVDILSSQTFFIGVGSDDYFRIKLNGTLILQTNLSPQTNGLAYSPIGMFTASWSVFPITLQSGPNYIELEGYNIGSVAVFGAEIYSGDVATLSAITSQSILDTYTIFSSRNMTGLTFNQPETPCPQGYILNSCNPSQYCVKVNRLPCEIPPPTTTTTTQSYLNPEYIPVNDCNVFSIAPMLISCNVTNETGKGGNGSITLNITGGTPPYTIVWTYPNGGSIQEGNTLGGLSSGSYTATVNDYYGDFIVSTTCVVSPPPTTTTTSTTTIIPIIADEFCLQIYILGKGDIIKEIIQIEFNPIIVGSQVSWISITSNESVYLDTNLNVWVLSASTSSIIYSNNINAYNPNPNALPYSDPPNNPGYLGWVINSLYPNTKSTANKGLCS